MRHTAGFVYGFMGNSPLHSAYDRANILDFSVPAEEVMSRMAKLPLAHEPGAVFEYSMATDVLGRIIEIVCNAPLDDCIEKRVTRPLGMVSTRFHVPEGEEFASPGEVDEKSKALLIGVGGRNPPGLSGGGGMYGTAHDYLCFAQMLLNKGELNGTRLLSPKTVDLMTANHLASSVRIPANVRTFLRAFAPTPEMGLGFGLGFGVRTANGCNPLPGSLGDYSWAGSFGTFFWVDPVEKLIAVIMTAQPQYETKNLYRQLARQLVYQALESLSPGNDPINGNPY
jgi:CubicO group peptidase (beta-lactamase class C family)